MHCELWGSIFVLGGDVREYAFNFIEYKWDVWRKKNGMPRISEENNGKKNVEQK